MKRRACDQCHGTDCQSYCEQGSCYAEEQQRQNEEYARDEQRRYDEEVAHDEEVQRFEQERRDWGYRG